jgi:hypothetical protein
VSRSSVVLIGLAGALMVALVAITGSSLGADRDAAGVPVAEPNVPRRAFHGAPPLVPHPMSDALAEGSACLPCHVDGGWVPSLGAYAPVVPHPELQSCWQCHVAQRATSVFERPSARGTR